MSRPGLWAAVTLLGALTVAGNGPAPAGAAPLGQAAPEEAPGTGEEAAEAEAAAAWPLGLLLPDSELVYGPSLFGVDAETLAQRGGGFLAGYSELVDGAVMSGPAIVRRVAEEYSVGPRTLLALVEAASGWVQDASPADRSHPVGGTKAGLYPGLTEAADALNDAFYGHRFQDRRDILLAEGRSLTLPDVNAGTFAVLSWLGPSTDAPLWPALIEPSRFYGAWTSLYGEAYYYQVQEVLPARMTAPPVQLPFAPTEIWFYVAGPHPPVGSGAAWAGVDFAPPADGTPACFPSPYWVTAAAGGLVTRSGPDGIVVDPDRDGDAYPGTGWVQVYRHLSSLEMVAAGRRVRAGDRLGHPSCEGGASAPSRVTIAQRYNGAWVPADLAMAPLVMDGWLPVRGPRPGAGYLVRGDVGPRQASLRKDPGLNGVARLGR